MDTNKIQLVLGAPASGKSIILKNIGFKLDENNKDIDERNKRKVYVVELKKHPHDEIKLFFENIPKIDGNPIFIVDDAHLYLSDCDKLIGNFRRNVKGNLIIGSRETGEISEEHPKEISKYELLSELRRTCIQIQTEDVTEGMLRTFLEKQYRYDNNKIKNISANLDMYKNDLWFLSWALKSYNKDKESVIVDEIYEKIASSIEEIRVGKDKDSINAEDVFLPVSIFYRYEIPIERYFLEELGIDRNIINKLIGLQEIEETKKTKMISMHHSSLAKLYFSTYLRYPYLGIRTKKNILNGKSQEDIEYYSFYRYIITLIDQRNVVDVAISLYDLTLLRKLAEEDNIQKSIEKGLEKEEYLEKIGNCISNIAAASKDVAKKLVENIDINGLFSKITKEEDIEKVMSCVSDIADSSEEVALKLVDSVSARINNEKHIKNVGRCVKYISFTSKQVAMKLANYIDLNILVSKITEEEDIENIGVCIECISIVDVKIALKLVDSFSAKIEKEKDIKRIGNCVGNIYNGEVGIKILDNINLITLASKIEHEDDIEKIILCLMNFLHIRKKAALKLLNIIDLNALASKIEKEDDIELIADFMALIDFMSEKHYNSLNYKLREEIQERNQSKRTTYL